MPGALGSASATSTCSFLGTVGELQTQRRVTTVVTQGLSSPDTGQVRRRRVALRSPAVGAAEPRRRCSAPERGQLRIRLVVPPVPAQGNCSYQMPLLKTRGHVTAEWTGCCSRSQARPVTG